MDHRDLVAGASQDNFWFQGKLGLIKFLLSQNLPKDFAKKELKILNVGVGTGDDLALISQHGGVYAIDIDQEALELVSSSVVVEKKCANVCALPYEDGFFDVVVSFDVLEHVDDHVKGVQEIYRVLKPGGFFVLTVPAFNTLYSSHDKLLHHYRRYNKKSLAKILVPFENSKLGYWFFFLFFPAALLRILEKVDLSCVVRLLGKIGLFKKKDNQESWHKTKLNWFFVQILRFENWLLQKGIRFPFGLTLYGICKKHE